MKLELTVTEDIIRNRFDIDTKYDNCRQRLKDHVLISSDELYALWEKDANLDSCKITIATTWDELGKKQTEQKFMRYLGVDAKIISVKEDDKHSSYIKTDKYIIDLGYRLQIFGFKDDGLTEAETITISRVE